MYNIPKNCLCKLLDFTPWDITIKHIEGFIQLDVDPNCPEHGLYLLLPMRDPGSNKFSIEVIEILDNKRAKGESIP